MKQHPHYMYLYLLSFALVILLIYFIFTTNSKPKESYTGIGNHCETATCPNGLTSVHSGCSTHSQYNLNLPHQNACSGSMI